MSKQVKLGTEARKQLVQGIDILADAVVSTLGPHGRNVVIAGGETPQSTKDGVTVAKSITLKDPIQELGVQLVKQAAERTADKAGDGTTTSTLLAREMVKDGLNALNNNENAVQIKRDIDLAVSDVVSALRYEISQDISGDGQLEQVATVSANNDPETGKLIATSIEKVGLEGVVHIEESRTGETYLETVEGLQFDKGYKSPYFVTDNNTMSTVLDNPFILIVDGKLTTVKDLVPILEGVSAQSRSLLIIADDVEQEALATLIVNKMRGIINVCAVQAPDFGDRRKLVLEDIAITTGGTVFSKEKGMKWDRFDTNWFGSSRTATISKEETTIVDGQGDADTIKLRIEELQAQIDKATTPYEIEKLQDRLAKFVGGVAIIHVGGQTETEMRERKDRVDDALHATKAAIEEGIVPGGGRALLQAKTAITNIDTTGGKIVFNACNKPFIQILQNAGIERTDAHIIANEVEKGDLSKSYDLKTDTIIDFYEAGIIDPTKVTRTALQNASSIAGTILLTEAVIVDEVADDKPAGGVDPTQFM